MISFKHKGNFNNTERFFKQYKNANFISILRKYGELGVNLLREYTPKDTGKTADSWSYRIEKKKNSFIITWANSNVIEGVPIVILLQYGHGTNSGTYVQGNDFINPAMKPVFEKLSEDLWKEVTA